MSNKSYNKSSSIFNKTNGNYKLTNTFIAIDDNGNSNTTTFIETGHVKSKEELRAEKRQKVNNGFSLFGKLFMIALILLFGGYFFNGGFNAQVQATEVNTIITNELNGVDYDYNIKYVDYDYTNKLNQLSLLRNVFDTSPINSVASSSLIVPNGNNLTPSLIAQNLAGNLVVKQYIFTDLLSNEEVSINYLSYNLGFKIAMWVNPQLQRDYEKYVNIGNLSDYINLNYSRETNELQPKVLTIILRVLTYLNAPIIWLGNFMYDLGVIINFIVSW